MAHKFTDLTLLGGLPLTQNDLLHDRNGVYEAIAAIYGDGDSNPMILSGTLSAGGWLVINKEVLPFTPPVFSPPLSGTLGYFIAIEETKNPVVFEDLVTRNAIGCTRVAKLAVADTLAPPAGYVPIDSFVQFHQYFGAAARAAAFVTLSGTSSAVDYSISYKKNLLNNTLHIKGSVTVKSAADLTNLYYYLGTLPVAFRPNTNVPFPVLYRYHGKSTKDSTSSDYIDQLNGELSTSGNFSVGARRPDGSVSSYIATFNCIIPLD